MHILFINRRALSSLSLPPSVDATDICPPSTWGFPISRSDHSSTTMTMPLRTKEITNGTNDPANTPTDASKNLNAHSTLNDGSQNARPSLKFKILLDNSALARWSVEGWMFRFRFPQNRPCRRRRRPSLRICPHAQAERAESKFNAAYSTFVRLEPCTPGKYPG